MKKTRNNMNILALGLVCALVCFPVPASSDELVAPEYLWNKGIAKRTDPVEIANTHLGIPYRDDGALDRNGHFTTFNNPHKELNTPGLNCSGLVVSVSRFLFGKNFSLSDVTKDRLGNSGPNAHLGKDWDFGLDLILNLTDGVPRRVMTPDRARYPLETSDPAKLRGVDLHDATSWQSILSDMKQGRVYFGTISKPTSRKGYRLLHYHVVLMLPDDKGRVWLYHSTRRSRVHRMDVTTPRGLNRLMAQFRRGTPKKILVVEALIRKPDTADAQPTGPGSIAGTKSRRPSDAVRDALGLTLQAAARTEKSRRNLTGEESTASTPSEPSARSDVSKKPPVPKPRRKTDLVIKHLSGSVFRSIPGMVTRVPAFVDEKRSGLRLWFRNREDSPRSLKILARGPDDTLEYVGEAPARGRDLVLTYPKDFGRTSSGELRRGRYAMSVSVDGAQWLENRFEVTVAREALPKITRVVMPNTARAGRTFTLKVTAQNKGAESDYGGITVSSPDPSALKLVSAKPGRIYGRGSTVLSVSSDKIKTKVPMAEQWIELWHSKKSYTMSVRVRAQKPGVHKIYVRCALRGVNIKSNVILMEPESSDTVDQQGFPVQVHEITVR